MSASNENLAGSVGEDLASPPMSQRLNVEEISHRQKGPGNRLTPPQPPTEPQQPSIAPPAARPPMSPISTVGGLSSVEAVLKLAAYAVSARALLFLALCGAFVLAVMAMATESLMRLYILTAYCLLVVAPIVALEFRKR